MSNDPQQQEKPITMADLEPVAGTVDGTPTLTDKVKSYWNRTMGGSALEPLQGWFKDTSDEGAKVVDNLQKSNHPYVAGMAKGYLEVQKDVESLLTGLATPTNVALAIGTGGESTAAKVLGYLSNLYFGYQGAKQILQPKQPGESTGDYVRRQAFSTAQTAAAGLGLGTATADFITSKVRGDLGLSGDLASKVEAKVKATAGIEAKAASDVNAATADTAKQLATTQAASEGLQASAADIAKGAGEQVAAEQPIRSGQIMADASQIAHSEQARVGNLFNDLSEKATTPVSTVGDIRAEIANSVMARGVQQDEIPDRVFNALPDNTTAVRALTNSEEKAAILVSKLKDQGMAQSDLRSTLVNLGYVPNQIDAVMNVGAPTASNDVSFKDLTRVREDLWQAAMASKDGAIRRGLFDAHENVTGIQERYAQDNGFGPAYRSAKNQYFTFKRELGGGEMNDFLNATEGSDQEMARHTLAITGKNESSFLRTILEKHGIDVSPLDTLVRESKDIPDAAQERIADIQGDAKATAKELNANQKATLKVIEQQKNQQLAAAEGITKPIIPGQSDLALEGKTNYQIRLEAMQRLANNMKVGGISRPYDYIQTMYGTAQLGMGSPFGLLHIFRGLGGSGIKALVSSSTFQDWVAQESGTTWTPKFGRAIESSGQALEDLGKKYDISNLVKATGEAVKQSAKGVDLRQAVKSSVAARTASNANENNIHIAP